MYERNGQNSASAIGMGLRRPDHPGKSPNSAEAQPPAELHRRSHRKSPAGTVSNRFRSGCILQPGQTKNGLRPEVRSPS